MKNEKAYIVDIDGTLANLEHRLHFIQAEPKDWDGFFDACGSDEPIWPVIQVIAALAYSYTHEFVYLTGRPERVRRETEAWLKDHNLPKGKIVMRRDGDHRQDTTAKRELLESLQAEGTEVVAVFEDRPSVCRVWREMGLAVFQMQHEEF